MDLNPLQAILWFFRDPRYFEYYYRLKIKELEGFGHYLCPNCGKSVQKTNEQDIDPTCRECSNACHESWCKYTGEVHSACPLCEGRRTLVSTIKGSEFFSSVKVKEQAHLNLESNICYDAHWAVCPIPFVSCIFLGVTLWLIMNYVPLSFITEFKTHKFEFYDHSISFHLYAIIPLVLWQMSWWFFRSKAKKSLVTIKEIRGTTEVLNA